MGGMARHLLIVDDDPRFRSFVAKGLEQSGMTVAVAGNSAEADALVSAADALAFDLILLDVLMPGEAGWGFLQRLRERGDQTPVIFVTARGEVDERIRGLRMGADDYVVKPFEFAELLARVESVLRRHQELPVLRSGELTLQVDGRRVRWGELETELSPKEFDLLVALVRADGSTLSRPQLLSQVWGFDFDPGTNSVDVTVKRIRKRLQLKAGELVQTVIGEGYRLVGE